MPYDPITGAEEFRNYLNEIRKKHGLSVPRIIEMYNEKRPPGNRMGFSASSLYRFIAGENVRGIAQLRFIYNMLMEMKSFTENEKVLVAEDKLEVTDMPSALKVFFTPQANVTNRYPLDVVREFLPGEYIMMRRDFEESAAENGVRLSVVFIKDAGDCITIEERQDYQRRHDTAGYRQRDVGYVFCYADYVYWLMKEVGNTATAVKLGVISYCAPEIGDGQGNYFSGYMFVSSRRGIFPLARFACRRYSPELHPTKSGIVKLSDILDIRALNHIKPDYI